MVADRRAVNFGAKRISRSNKTDQTMMQTLRQPPNNSGFDRSSSWAIDSNAPWANSHPDFDRGRLCTVRRGKRASNLRGPGRFKDSLIIG